MLKFEKLIKIAGMIREYFPETETIGCFSRLTDVTLKTDQELADLHCAGYDMLTIGIETADDEALRFMEKGYLAADIIEQCGRLDKAGIRYSFFYLTGISGEGRGERGAKITAAVCNKLHPILVGANMLTIYPNSKLYEEIQKGNWKEESFQENIRVSFPLSLSAFQISAQKDLPRSKKSGLPSCRKNTGTSSAPQ